MTNLIAVRGVVKKFGTVTALKDVSFDIRPGEVHALLGENGAGKSTLMKILSGIYEPTSGEIQLGDTTYTSLSPDVSKQFGIRLIYQELGVPIKLVGVGEQIEDLQPFDPKSFAGAIVGEA